jgi:hypothetical protein
MDEVLPVALRTSWSNSRAILLERTDAGFMHVDGGFFKILRYHTGIRVYEVHVIGRLELAQTYIETKYSVPEIVAFIRNEGFKVSRNAEQWLRRLEGYHG